jgi:hypothetical protein
MILTKCAESLQLSQKVQLSICLRFLATELSVSDCVLRFSLWFNFSNEQCHD